MSHQEQQPKKLDIMKYWQLIIAIIMVVAGWVTIQNKQASADLRIEKIEVAQLTSNAKNTEILVQLSGIQSDLSWIKATLANKAKQQQ